mgnify:FL=1
MLPRFVTLPRKARLFMPDQFSRRQSIRKPAVETRGGAVASQSRLAAEAGAAVLAGGGNAIDAAVVTALAVGVAEPWMSGLGGGGCLLLRLAGESRVRALDFGMRSPVGLDVEDYPLAESGADSDLFGWPAVIDQRNLRGASAVAVPGQVAGLAEVLERFGTLPWAEALAPAIALADEGIALDWYSQLQITNAVTDLRRDPGCRAVYLDDDGLPPGPLVTPRMLRNDALPACLRRLADKGPAEFYEGDIARSIVSEVRDAGGSLAMADLESYRPRWVEPLEVRRPEAKLFVLPELNGGPTLARALDALAIEPKAGAQPDATFFAAFTEAMLEAFAFRLANLGDHNDSAAPSCTTHLSAIDAQGNMVALTQTLLSVFGARLTLPGTGILMNNGINWFDPRPGQPNSLAPGKRTLSNYVPVIGEAADRAFAIGASGGRKIIGAMAQMASFLGDYRLSLDSAIHHPRVDVSGLETVGADPCLDPDILAALEARFPVERKVRGVAPNNYAIPCGVLREGEVNFAAADPYHPWAEAVSETDSSRGVPQ